MKLLEEPVGGDRLGGPRKRRLVVFCKFPSSRLSLLASDHPTFFSPHSNAVLHSSQSSLPPPRSRRSSQTHLASCSHILSSQALFSQENQSNQQPWQTRPMARITNNNSSSSSSNYYASSITSSTRSTLRASCYTVDARSTSLQGFHYSSTGAHGVEWYP